MKYFLILLSLISCITYAETRTKVVIIDSGISRTQSAQKYMCKNGNKNFTDSKNKYDEHGHGTNILSIISKSINRLRTKSLIYLVFIQLLVYMLVIILSNAGI